MKKSVIEAIKRGEDIYLMVVYCHDGGIHMLPCGSKEICYTNLLKMRADPKCCERIAATTIVKRGAAAFGDGMLFGHPKSLDVMSLSEKQFENACEKYGVDRDDSEDFEYLVKES